METRQTRIQMLSRIGRGRKELPHFAAALSKTLGFPLSTAQFIPLPETDKLWEIYGEGYSESRLGTGTTYRRFFKPDQWNMLSKLTTCVVEGLHKDEAFLLLGQSKTCGAVLASVPALLSHFEQLIDLDGDGLRLVSGDLAQGLMIDRNPDDPVWFVEVAVWGERWSQVFASYSADFPVDTLAPRAS
jgi:hypothetical protein